MRKLIVTLSISLSLSGCISQPSLLPTMQPLQESKVSGEGKHKILMINISGMLTSAKPSGFVAQLLDRPSLPARLKEELTKAGQDKQIKAIILRINSPGGTVTASDILYHEIQQFKEKYKIPVVASIIDLGTSGGYYLLQPLTKFSCTLLRLPGVLASLWSSSMRKGCSKKLGLKLERLRLDRKSPWGLPFVP